MRIQFHHHQRDRHEHLDVWFWGAVVIALVIATAAGDTAGVLA